jgi:hypothetical protein
MQKIFVQHWRWLEAQGESYKQQATSCKQQAASLTRKNYNVIGYYKIKKARKHEQERSKDNNRWTV